MDDDHIQGTITSQTQTVERAGMQCCSVCGLHDLEANDSSEGQVSQQDEEESESTLSTFLLEYCLHGCFLCRVCASSDETRRVLFDPDGSLFYCKKKHSSETCAVFAKKSSKASGKRSYSQRLAWRRRRRTTNGRHKGMMGQSTRSNSVAIPNDERSKNERSDDEDDETCSVESSIREEYECECPYVEYCLLCEGQGLLKGRDNLHDFVRICHETFDKKEKPKKKLHPFEVPSCEQGQGAVVKNNSIAPYDRKETKVTFEGFSKESAHGRESKNFKKDKKRKAMHQGEKDAAKGMEGSVQETGVLFQWSGGMVNILSDDLQELFTLHPVVEDVFSLPDWGEEPFGFTRALRILDKLNEDGEGSSGLARPQRKLSIRNVVTEINEIYEHWIRKCKEHKDKRVIPMAEFVADFTFKQYGIKKIADQHLLDLTSAVKLYTAQSERIASFGKLVGIVKPELYSHQLSSVLFDFFMLCFETIAEFREVLCAGEGGSFISFEKGQKACQGLFESSDAWNFTSVKSLCESKGSPTPWDSSTKNGFLGNIGRLCNTFQKKGLGRSSISVQKSASATRAMDLDTVVHFLTSGWLAERSKVYHGLLRIQSKEKSLVVDEMERRKEAIRAADRRPCLAKEESVIRGIVSDVLKKSGLQEMPAHWQDEAWQSFWMINQQRKESSMPYVFNRTRSGMTRLWHSLERTRVMNEKIAWDFQKWEWDEDWEWDGINLIHSADEVVQEGENSPPEDSRDESTLGRARSVPTIVHRPVSVEHHHSWISQQQLDTLSSRGTVVPGRERGAGEERLSFPSRRLPPLEKGTRVDSRPVEDNSGFSDDLEEIGIVIDLSYYYAGNQCSSALKDALHGYRGAISGISGFVLSENALHDEDGAQVLETIEKDSWGSLRKLDLSRNRLGKRSVGKLCAMVSSTGSCQNLVELQLAGNRIGNTNACALLNVIATHHSLRTLNLSENDLGGSKPLAEALALAVSGGNQGSEKHLHSLLLGWNRLKTSDFAQLWSCDHNLKQLAIPFNVVDASFLDSLSCWLKASPTRRFEQVDLSNNYVSQDSLDAWRKSADGPLLQVRVLL